MWRRVHSAEGISMKISSKLGLFYGAVLTVFAFLSVALILEIRTLSTGYDAVLNSTVHEMEQARIVQVDFKKQVQEWKDILLRGHTPTDLEKYTKQFHDESQRVSAGAGQLESEARDPQVRGFLDQFIRAHQELDSKYEQAYSAYVSGNFDFKTADSLVRGQDRAPTDLFDQTVGLLQMRMQASIAAQQESARTSRNVALGAAGGLLLLLGVVGFAIVKDVLYRLGRLKAVSDRLAVADISGLVVDISGNDEIGAFGRSLAGVHAAIEELMNSQSAAASAAR